MPNPDATQQSLIGSRRACELLGGINRSSLERLVLQDRLAPVARLEDGTLVFDEAVVREFAETYQPRTRTAKPAEAVS